MKKLLLLSLLLTGCVANRTPPVPGAVKAPWNEWYFIFTTPKALPAQVTLLTMMDINRHGYVFRTIDQPQGGSKGTWSQRKGGLVPAFNRAKAPPLIMTFCWDSIIDKKVYETQLFFRPDTWQAMVSPYPDVINPARNDYRRTMIIGLAPQGVVRVWLQQYGHSDILQASTEVTTVSDEKLDMCRGVTNFTRGYEYSEDMKAFIKDKQYPYGSW